MRELSAGLSAAQIQASRVPYVKVEVTNKMLGVVRLQWSRLYTGSEADYLHTMTMPGDGSLIRLRLTPPADSRKLYIQRVANPAPGSDFSQWTYTGWYNVAAAACCSVGNEVSLFWIGSNRSIYQLQSTDYGANWDSPQFLGSTPTTAINGLAAVYKPNGDIAVFFADGANLYVLKRAGGVWQSAGVWDKTTGALSGVAAVYAGDWELMVTGKDIDGNYRVWSLVYGDGSEEPTGTWSALKTMASAPADGDYSYSRPFLDKPDVYRCFFVESYSGIETYHRPFRSNILPETDYTASCWVEPVPFNLSGEYGLAISHHGNFCWLSSASGVWRAQLTADSLDLTADVVSLKQELKQYNGKLLVALSNDDAKYCHPGEGALSALDIGSQVNFSPGYRTSAGDEASSGQSYVLEAYEHINAGGKDALLLYACDGWQSMEQWAARQQFRWNRDSNEMSVKEILAAVLARAGLKLEVKSQSSAITGFYPDFIIHAGEQGMTVIKQLLSLVPDVLFIEGNKAYLINPLSTDNAVYSYGGTHQILEGRYKRSAWEINRAQVEGWDAEAENPIVVDCFSWDEVDRLGDILQMIEDRNIGTVEQAQQRGQACLRRVEIESVSGAIRIPVNCAQQLWDVIDITDTKAGLIAAKKRVPGFNLHFEPEKGIYEQRLSLGAV